MSDDRTINLRVTTDTADLIRTALESVVNDPTEPERYIDWYTRALDDLTSNEFYRGRTGE